MLNVRIWLPPEEDHADWQALTGERISRDEFERLAAEALRGALATGWAVSEDAVANFLRRKAGMGSHNLEHVLRVLGLTVKPE
jgi:hypothetical protein